MTTLITDGFDEEVPGPGIIGDLKHNIVYGAAGWTDALSDDDIAVLVKATIISFVRAVGHDEGETRIYVSRKGNTPA